MKGKHTTLDKNLKNSVLWLEGLPGVNKVILGISEACRHRYTPGHLRFKREVEGGIKLNGYSGNGIIDIFVRIDPIEKRESIKIQIEKRFLN